MKRTTLITGVVMLCAAAWGGWTVGRLDAFRDMHRITARQSGLQARIEGYVPSCAELAKVGLHAPVTRGKDVILVDVKEHSFIVVGFNAEAGLPPVTGWWGADKSCP